LLFAELCAVISESSEGTWGPITAIMCDWPDNSLAETKFSVYQTVVRFWRAKDESWEMSFAVFITVLDESLHLFNAEIIWHFWHKWFSCHEVQDYWETRFREKFVFLSSLIPVFL
jgi:hypothetical protein